MRESLSMKWRKILFLDARARISQVLRYWKVSHTIFCFNHHMPHLMIVVYRSSCRPVPIRDFPAQSTGPHHTRIPKKGEMALSRSQRANILSGMPVGSLGMIATRIQYWWVDMSKDAAFTRITEMIFMVEREGRPSGAHASTPSVQVRPKEHTT